ncbi:MAG: hypothetical protein RJA31_617, partial [Actinomycetota bacterium]
PVGSTSAMLSATRKRWNDRIDDRARVIDVDASPEKKHRRSVPLGQQRWAPTNEIRIDRIPRKCPERHDSLLVSFTRQGDDIRHLIRAHVVHRECDDFGDTTTRRVEQFEQCTVAQTDRGVRRSRLEQRGHLLDRQCFREPLRAARRKDRTSRVNFGDAFRDEETVERPNRRQSARNRRGREPRAPRTEVSRGDR